MRAIAALLAVLWVAGGASAQDAAAELAQAEEQADRGLYEAADVACRRHLEGPLGARAAMCVARLDMQLGRYDDAVTHAERAASEASLRIAARTLVAEAHLARGRLDEAEPVLRALESEPSAHRARVVLGRLLTRRGQSDAARPVLMRLIAAFNDHTIGARDAEGLAYVAMAAALLGSAHDANDAFQDSARVDPRRVETQLEWAELFLSKYDPGHAEECLRDAIAVDPRSARAHALMARVRLYAAFDFEAATDELDVALDVNPSLVMAHVTRASMAMRDLDLVTADRHLDAALAIDPRDLEALSMRAAVRFLAEDDAGYRRAVAAVLALNPRYSTLYSIIGEHAEWEHRYPEIVAMARQALELDGDDERAWATLGLNLLRMGDETEGLAALRQARRRDRFEVRVFNMLNFFDGPIARDYQSFDARPFRFRMHREERPVLEALVPGELRAAYDDMRRRYRFTPRGPIHIEMFASQTHFSVRTDGLPNIGVQGVCFGQVVTALSPRGGQFDWAQITTHELAHVFHIQLSRNRVPRWFTEGLAEHETVIRRPEWRREEDHRLYRALSSGRIPPIRDLNHAFTHARSIEDAITAYYASSRVVAYIADRFGFPALVAMLRGWGQRRATPDVVQRALRISIDDLDRDFRAAELARLASRAGDFAVDFAAHDDVDASRARVAASPTDAAAHAELAAALVFASQEPLAVRSAMDAIGLDAHQPTARFVLAVLSMERGDAIDAETHLRDLLASGHDGFEVRMLQARAAMRQGRPADARAALEAATRIDADRVEAWDALLAIATESSDAALRFEAARHVVDLDQHVRAPLAGLMDMLEERGAWAELATYGERALHTDPERARARELLGRAYVELDRAGDALPQLDAALLLAPEHPGRVHLLRARALAALRRASDARAAAEAAVAVDASLAAEAAPFLR